MTKLPFLYREVTQILRGNATPQDWETLFSVLTQLRSCNAEIRVVNQTLANLLIAATLRRQLNQIPDHIFSAIIPGTENFLDGLTRDTRFHPAAEKIAKIRRGETTNTSFLAKSLVAQLHRNQTVDSNILAAYVVSYGVTALLSPGQLKRLVTDPLKRNTDGLLGHIQKTEYATACALLLDLPRLVPYYQTLREQYESRRASDSGIDEMLHELARMVIKTKLTHASTKRQ